MDILVRINDKLTLNIANGETRGDTKGSIPLTAQVAVRKTKPAMKFAKKAGDVYLGCNKMSLAYILAFYMLKSNKKRVIGFYKHEDTYIFIEATVDIHKSISIRSGITTSKETPEVFLKVEGKTYEGIFGNADVTNIDLQFSKLYKELSQRTSPMQVAALIIILIAIGVVGVHVFKKPSTIKLPTMVKKEPPPPPPLSPEEAEKLMGMAKKEMIKKYTEAAEELASRDDQWLKKFEAKFIQGTLDVKSDAILTYESFYPFSGAKKEGGLYSWAKSQGASFGRDKIEKGQAETKGSFVCLKYFINYEVTERRGKKWTVTLKEKDYPKITFLLNLIYRCPCIIKDMSIDENGLVATVVVDSV